MTNTSPSFPPPVRVGRGAYAQHMPGTLGADCEHGRRPGDLRRGGLRRCRPTNSGGRRPSANSSASWSAGQLRRSRRRLFTIIGSAVGALLVIGAVVATVIVTNKGSNSNTASADTPTPRPRRRPHPPPDGKLPRVRRARRPRRELPVPGRRGGEQEDQPAAHRQGAHRPAADQRQHDHQPGQHRPAAGQRQGALHGQQLRQPGAAGLLQRHPVPPADHVAGLAVLQCGDPTGTGHRRPRLRVRQRIPDQPVPARQPGAAAAGGLPARHAGDGQRRAPAPTAASSSSSTRIRSCRRTTPPSAPSTRRAWPRWTRSPRQASTAAARDGKPKLPVQIKSIQLD